MNPSGREERRPPPHPVLPGKHYPPPSASQEALGVAGVFVPRAQIASLKSGKQKRGPHPKEVPNPGYLVPRIQKLSYNI